MKRLSLAVLCLAAWWLLLAIPASAAISDIKIRHLAPANKATIHGGTDEGDASFGEFPCFFFYTKP